MTLPTMATPSDNHWHLDKKVPISIIMVLLTQFVGGLWIIADIKKDVEVLKSISTLQVARDQRQDSDSLETKTLIRQDIREVNGKLDRLIERPLAVNK